jgi:hypothetical protein
MAGPTFLLDFRRGTVEAIDEAVRPSGVRDPSSTVELEQLPAASGYVLAALGTPPRVRESNSHVSPGPPTRVRRDAAGNTRKGKSCAPAVPHACEARRRSD